MSSNRFDRGQQAPSRSALKREDQARQKLAGRLVELKPSALAKLEIGADLEEAVRFAASKKEHGARRREILHVGALLRNVDYTEIENRLADGEAGRLVDGESGSSAEGESVSNGEDQARRAAEHAQRERERQTARKAARKQIEDRATAWKDALLTDEADAMDQMLRSDVEIEVSRLRQLVRSAKKKPTTRNVSRLMDCLREIARSG